MGKTNNYDKVQLNTGSFLEFQKTLSKISLEMNSIKKSLALPASFLQSIKEMNDILKNISSDFLNHMYPIFNQNALISEHLKELQTNIKERIEELKSNYPKTYIEYRLMSVGWWYIEGLTVDNISSLNTINDFIFEMYEKDNFFRIKKLYDKNVNRYREIEIYSNYSLAIKYYIEENYIASYLMVVPLIERIFNYEYDNYFTTIIKNEETNSFIKKFNAINKKYKFELKLTKNKINKGIKPLKEEIDNLYLYEIQTYNGKLNCAIMLCSLFGSTEGNKSLGDLEEFNRNKIFHGYGDPSKLTKSQILKLILMVDEIKYITKIFVQNIHWFNDDFYLVRTP